MRRLPPPRFAAALAFSIAAAGAAALAETCPCTPSMNGAQGNFSYRWESINNVPLSGLQALAGQASGKWNTQFSNHGVDASLNQGAGGFKIVVNPNYHDGQAEVDGNGNIQVPEEWVTRVDPPFPSDYIMAVFLHEFGHVEGFAQASCSASVMGNTTLSSYRTDFTSCDHLSFNNYWGVPQNEDPCQWGCAPGYTTTCVGDQQPDACGCCVNYSPIVLDNAAPRFGSPSDGVLFRINSLGTLLRLAWPISPTTAFLALDRNGNGIIDDGLELFGNTTPLVNGGVARNGYEALADLDGNRDKVVDEADPGFAELWLWRDVNRDGVSQAAEVSRLADNGVRALSVEPRTSERRDRFGNRFTLRAKVFFEDGSERYSYDVYPAALKPDGKTACVVTPRPRVGTTSSLASAGRSHTAAGTFPQTARHPLP